MMGRRYSPRWGRLLGALTVLVTAGSAGAQVGEHLSMPSSFITPLSSFGVIGGRYTNSTEGFVSRTPDVATVTRSLAPGTALTPGLGTEGGGVPAYQFSLQNLQPARQTLNVIGSPLANGFAAPMAAPIGSYLGDSVPGYDEPQIPRLNTMFDPTVHSDSFTKVLGRHPFDLKDVTPVGPSPSAVGADRGPKSPTSRPAFDQQILSMRDMSRRQLDKFSDQGEACLQRAMEALKSEQYHDEQPKWGTSDAFKSGAIELFRQARMLLTGRPEPTMGLIASLVATGDYNQAASLIGPLAVTWPEVLGRGDFAQKFYPRQDQLHKHLLAIRTMAAERMDPDLRLLAAFYRWHVENKVAVFADVFTAARQGTPDSPAAALADAMRQALQAQGG